MTHQEATKLLDMAREGHPIPEDVLLEALFLTGDSPCPCPDIEEFVQAMREAGQL